MTQLINLETSQLTTEAEFRAAHPNTSFPAVINWSEFNHAVVFPTPQPTYDTITQSVRPSAPVLTDKGHYEQAWEVVDLDAETVASNRQAANQAHNAGVIAQIAALELKQPRAVREALLGQAGAADRLQALDDEIAALRATLK